MLTVVYNLETYPNLFVATFKPLDQSAFRSFEISERRDQRHEMFLFLRGVTEMIGFNNFGFDWPLLSYFREFPNATTRQIWEYAETLIKHASFRQIDWNPDKRQIDLFRIHHFDNKQKSTSLYKLKFNMRLPTIRMMPYKAGSTVPIEGIDQVITFNYHHVEATERFYHLSADKIAFRESLDPSYINYSDSKIGKQFVIEALAKEEIDCYEWRDGRKVPKQTLWPNGVPIGDIILPLIEFRSPVLKALLEDVKGQTLGQDDAFKREFQFAGLEVTFGKGGLHASVNRRRYVDGCILDLDVVSYYPNIAIRNRIYPRHLGPAFCDVYERLYDKRKLTKKGESNNLALKLGLNSVYGDSGNPYSVFFDISYMFAITFNGQLMLLMLAEDLMSIEGVELIQANTDGLTIRCPEDKRAYVQSIADAWARKTQMPLELNRYKRLFIRDVNSYIGEFEDGKRKYKGAYLYNREWHQNHGGLVVPKVAEKVLLEDEDADIAVRMHADQFDFMYRINATEKNPLVFNVGTPAEYDQTGVVRYYLSESGERFKKRIAKGLQSVHLSDVSDLKGKRGAWHCPECWEVCRTKALLIEHIQEDHAPKFQLAIDYDGEPINIDVGAYVSEINKLTRDFI